MSQAIISDIRRRLAKYSHVQYQHGDREIEIMPVDHNGFVVSLIIVNDQFVVGFEGWHEEFSDADEALDCLSWGLTDQCRLSVESRWGVEYRWTVEARNDGQWRVDSAVGLLFYPYLGCYQQRHLQNRILTG